MASDPPPDPPQQPTTTSTTFPLQPPTLSPTLYEETHVHSIYTSIAPHFSLTRRTPWPLVSSFLSSRRPGCIGLDLGCGNGKNLPEYSSSSTFILASDRSASLIEIATRDRKNELHAVLQADVLSPPHPPGIFDFAICIAVLHHLSTAKRRIEGVRSILSCLHEKGEALIFVWALEQEKSRRGWREGGEVDVLVPWVMREKGRKEKEGGKGGEETTFQRYYHLSVEGELEGWVRDAGGVVVRGGWERDNWWVVARRGTRREEEDEES